MSQELQQHEAPVTGLTGFKKKPMPADPGGGDILQQIDEARGNNSVIHGAREMKLSLSGQKVSAVRPKLQGFLNFAPDASAFINGEKVEEDYVIKQGEVLEFLKEAGVKGR